jgi:hypothetical protein
VKENNSLLSFCWLLHQLFEAFSVVFSLYYDFNIQSNWIFASVIIYRFQKLYQNSHKFHLFYLISIHLSRRNIIYWCIYILTNVFLSYIYSPDMHIFIYRSTIHIYNTLIVWNVFFILHMKWGRQFLEHHYHLWKWILE